MLNTRDEKSPKIYSMNLTHTTRFERSKLDEEADALQRLYEGQRQKERDAIKEREEKTRSMEAQANEERVKRQREFKEALTK